MNTFPCPRCKGKLGPELHGIFKHFPVCHFCEKCTRFFDAKDLKPLSNNKESQEYIEGFHLGRG